MCSAQWRSAGLCGQLSASPDPQFRVAARHSASDMIELERNLWSTYGPVGTNLVFPRRPEAAFTFPFVAIRTAKFQCVTASIGTVTAEAAGSGPVVPAIPSRRVRARSALQLLR